MDAAPNGSKIIKATGTALDVLEAIQTLDGATVTELASYLDRSKSTIHGHVTTLRSRGYLIKQEGDRYCISLQFLDLGMVARERHSYLKDIQPMIERLATETEERVQYMVRENDYGVYIYRASGKKGPPTDARVGRPRELHVCAAGKSILAMLSDDQIQSVIDRQGLAAKTENTITNPDVLYENLATVRKRGFAINDQESVEGVWAIATPVTDDDGSLLGALSISGPNHRMKGHQNHVEHYSNRLLGIAEEIELNITYS